MDDDSGATRVHPARLAETPEAPQRSLLRPYPRDALLLITLAMMAAAWSMAGIDDSMTLIVLGPLTGGQLAPVLLALAAFTAVAWVASRMWLNGGPRHPVAAGLTQMTVVVLSLAAVCWAALMAFFVPLSGPEIHERVVVPGSGDAYVVSISATSGSDLTVWRGGHFVFHRVEVALDPPARAQDVSEHEFRIARVGQHDVLSYRSINGEVSVPLPR